MANAWGQAWGLSWGDAWGAEGEEPPVDPPVEEVRHGAGRFLDDDWPIYQRMFIEQQNLAVVALAAAMLTNGSIH